MNTRIVAGIAIAIAAITGMGLGALGVAAVSAQAPTPPPDTPSPPAAGQPVRLVGNVSSVAAGRLVLTTRRGDVTVNIGADTFIVVKENGQSAEGTAADIVAGERATVAGVATSDPNVVDARMITQGTRFAGRPLVDRSKARRAARHTAAGTITAINGNTITLQGVKVPEVIVETGTGTVVMNNGFTTVGSLKVGDKVAVLGAPQRAANIAPGTPPQSRAIKAWGIRVDNGATRLSAARVDAVNGDTLTVRTIKDRSGVTIQLDANTEYRALTISPADRSATLTDAAQTDIQESSNLIVEGVPGPDGKTVTAVAVVILPDRKLR
jgi:hypothetical protein